MPGCAALDLEQHHERSQSENRDEEEQIVAHDRADNRHLRLRRGKHAVFGKLMQAGDDQLRGDEEQNHRGDAEELLQIDADAAFDEHHSE